MIIHPDDPQIHSLSQLNRVIALSHSTDLSVGDALFTADQLVRHGRCDHAQRVVDRLAAAGHRNETLGRWLRRLSAAAEHVRSVSGLSAILADEPGLEKLFSLRSSTYAAGHTAQKLVVVYSTAYNNFDISFPFLHCLLAPHADRILYVKNPGRGIYTTGNSEYGSSIDEMSSRLCGLLASINPSHVTVMGFSGGGYAALHLAAKARADVFVGLGVRTDWSRDSACELVRGRTAPDASDYATNTLCNMRDMPEITEIRRAVLYYGDRDDTDRSQALNMAGLPNFAIHAVRPGTHNLVMDFLASGRLPELISNSLD